MARRGNAGRKRRKADPIRPASGARPAGPSNKEKAGFISKHRFLIVKKSNELTEQQWTNLRKMFDYWPRLYARCGTSRTYVRGICSNVQGRSSKHCP